AARSADIDDVKQLFGEYAQAPGREPEFPGYLAAQRFDLEVAGLPGAYAPPGGGLLIARVNGRAAGCVAFKALEPPTICEMKRLYLRPDFRGMGMGEKLGRAVMDAAR